MKLAAKSAVKRILTIQNIVFTAVFAAFICIFTAYFPRIPTINGYIHLGDSMIYLAASILPFPLGLIAASIGGGLADMLTGYALYILPTMLIKPMNALCFSSKGTKLLTTRNIIGIFISSAVTIIGYAVAEMIMFGSLFAGIATLSGNAVQAAGSGVFYFLLSILLDKAKLIQRIKSLI